MDSDEEEDVFNIGADQSTEDELSPPANFPSYHDPPPQMLPSSHSLNGSLEIINNDVPTQLASSNDDYPSMHEQSSQTLSCNSDKSWVAICSTPKIPPSEESNHAQKIENVRRRLFSREDNKDDSEDEDVF